MWLMTKHGSYSIVQKKPGEFHIRSRQRHDLQNLIDRVPLPMAQIIHTPTNDYAFRVLGDQAVVHQVLSFLGDTLDYDNFKNHISRTPDQKHMHKPYAEIWGVLATALGSYGQPGRGESHSL